MPVLRPMVWAALTCAGWLTGCANTDLHPQSSMTPTSRLVAPLSKDTAPVSPAAWPSANWWESFGDPQLNRLVDEGLAQSPTLKLAAARIRLASAALDAASAKLDGHVEGGFSSTRERFSSDGTTPHPVAGTWQVVNQGLLSGGYDLDFWGKNAEGLQAALGRTHAAEVDSHAARLMVSSAIVQSYIALAQLEDQLEIERRLLDQQQTLLGLTRKRMAAELDSRLDLKQSEAALPATRAHIAALSEQLELGRNQLATLVGQGPDRGQAITRPHMTLPASAEVPTALTANLLGRRPDIVAQRWRVEASAHDIKVAQARFYPDINISAFLGLQSLGFGDLDQGKSRILGVGPAISLPIFDAGRLRANLAGQDAAYDMAVEAYNASLLDAVRDIADQLSSLRWLQEQLSQQRQAVATASEAAALAQKRYAGGLGTAIQVLVAQNAVLVQRRQLSVLDSRALSLQAQLSRALGGGYLPGPPGPEAEKTAYASMTAKNQSPTP